MNKEQLRGYIFEILVLKLVISSGYHIIENFDKQRMKRKGLRSIEYKGRGGYHQIDVPVDCDYVPDFIYPIRLLGEVKSRDRITKTTIRELIGEMIDIQQNYTDEDYSDENQRMNRKTEVFSIFSAKGFNIAAEKLAFAHNIKTISFRENPDLEILDSISESISDRYKDSSAEIQKELLDYMYDFLIFNNQYYSKKTNRTMLAEFEFVIKDSVKLIESIKTSFFGTTSSGLTIFFTSSNCFPFDDLFKNTDSIMCHIHINEKEEWYLTNDNCDAKLYFSMPEMIKNEIVVKNGIYVYPKKGREFEKINFKMNVNGIKRSLYFKFDEDWFRNFL